MRWLVAVVLVGCGDNLVDESGEDRSGTQLKLRWFEYPDGARELAWSNPEGRLYDARFDARCELVEWADGITRCTLGARRELFSNNPSYAVGVFTDETCTQLVGRSIREADFVLLGEFRGEQHYPTQLFRGGNMISTGTYYERRDGGCAGPFTVASSSLYEVGLLIPTSDLVALENRELETTGRLAHRVLDGNDGSELWRGFYDRTLGVDCSMQCVVGAGLACVPTAAPPDSIVLDQLAAVTLDVDVVAGRRLVDRVAVAGSLRTTFGLFDTVTNSACSAIQEPFGDIFGRRCVPFAAGFEDAYAESTCKTPVRVVRRELGECAFTYDYAYNYDYEARRIDYFEVRQPLAEAFVLAETGDCVPFGVPQGYEIRSLGPAIARDSFPVATLVVDR
jgi:hypothetical protein